MSVCGQKEWMIVVIPGKKYTVRHFDELFSSLFVFLLNIFADKNYKICST